MEERLNYEEFAPLLGKWAPKFKKFIEGKEMFDIYQKIKEDAKKETIVPISDNVFSVFRDSDPNNIKSIWFLMDPYPRRYKGTKIPQATGTAMDCSNSPDGKLQPSLEKFYEGMKKCLDKRVEWTPSLKYLTEQGVLLLNTDLTVKLNKTGSHEGLWSPFHKFFLEEVMRSYTGIIYVLSGNVSHKMEKYINPLGNYIFKIEHPAAASHKGTEWDCKNIFKITNKLLHDMNGSEVFWSKEDFENMPF